ncbi:MAG TPA: TolC family protein [Bryobacteraceae bacterium]|nr:TolC family protein [Bryobacteraceae bacterium]
MKRNFAFKWSAGPLAALLLFAGEAHAQLPGQSVPTQTPTATPLPLSGRSTQNGSVTAIQTPTPGTTTSVNTLNTSVQAQGAYSGSVSGASHPFSGTLSFKEAIERGLAFNLGQVGLEQGVRQTRGQMKVVRSALLPNLNSSLTETVQQTNLRALGVRINSPFPGFSIPSVVGPFNYFDLRARLTQTVANITQIDNYRAAKELVHAGEQSAQDAGDLVVLAVGGAYMQVMAAEARVRTERSQVETAKALFDQASQQRAAGVLALTDLNRSEVQLLTERQRLVSLENDLSKQKINLARLTGLPPTDAFQIRDDVPFVAAPDLDEQAALKEAYEHRADLKAAEAQVRAARLTHAAARAERLPSLSLSADYGAIGTNPNQAHGTFAVVGTLSMPIWQGGRAGGDMEQASAALAQRRAELEDTRSRVESEVRNAFLDLRSAAQQVEVARRNIEVSKQNLELTRQRFSAGVSDNVEVVQAQQSVSSAELDYIDSVFAHNIAKLSLARAVGGTAENLPRFLGLH